jgi:hypothetical protein
MDFFVECINYKCAFFFNLIGLLARRSFILSYIIGDIYFLYQIFFRGSSLCLVSSIFSRKITNYYLISNIIPSSRVLALSSSIS